MVNVSEKTYQKGKAMIKNTLEVYQMLGDECSKEIYGQRILLSLTKDEKYKDGIVCNGYVLNWLRTRLQETSSRNVLLYGAGKRGTLISRLCPNMFMAIIDEGLNKQGKLINGLKVLSISEAIKEYSNPVVVISNKYEIGDIKNSLIKWGISEEDILELEPKLTESIRGQYFDLEELKPESNEVFIDCGAFDGDTSIAFMKWSNERFKHIYCFEPDVNNYTICKNNLEKYINREDITIINKGTWDSRKELNFSDTADVASHICDEGQHRIEAVSLDEEILVKRNEKVTFIKMDIEGAELKTLKGARRIISEQHPKLAICVYHRPEDIFEIPEYIKTLNPNYKFYFRHYTLAEWDTVLYAIP